MKVRAQARQWLHYGGDLLAPLCRRFAGAITPVIPWRHYAEDLVAPLRRRRIGSIMPAIHIYGAVVVLCFVTFRNWRAVVVAVVPLVITSILCEALMVALDIGVKVATLPVTALGVGIGVDYALYLLSVQLSLQRRGYSLEQAYLSALTFTGKVIALIGITLAAAVATWAWSPIKFQADMGILLAFMFLWNMIGALILVPALSCFLLAKVSASKNEHMQRLMDSVPVARQSCSASNET